MLGFPGTQQHRAAEQEPQLGCVQEGKSLLPGSHWEESEGFLSPQCVLFLYALEKIRKSCEDTLKRRGRGTRSRGRGQGAGARLPGPFRALGVSLQGCTRSGSPGRAAPLLTGISLEKLSFWLGGSPGARRGQQQPGLPLSEPCRHSSSAREELRKG